MTTQKLADLRVAPLFAHLDDGQLERFAALATLVEFPAERTIFLQGDAAEGFFLISAGRVKVFKMLRDGRTATVRHVEAGQTFAEAALFHETYPSSTETMAESRLYRFDKRKVLDLLLAEPQLSVNLLAAMAHLLGLLNRRVEELLLPVPARLARYLLTLADAQLQPPAGGPAAAGVPASPRVVKLPT
ncbi:MAG: Crp/Fnr family transcriptional regulator, partial [Actinomycetes bacterium]